MTTIVPTDFSATANNAAFYAAKMLAGNYDATILLYHVYDEDEEADETEKLLHRLREEIMYSAIVKIECRLEKSYDFIDSLERLVRHLDADLVIMGINGKSKMEQWLFGSNTLKLAERNVCPVLIIPPATQYIPIKNVVLSSDYKNIETSLPIAPIKKLLSIMRPNLYILNVHRGHYVSLTNECLAERERFREMFHEFSPEFYFIGSFDVENAILQFIQDKNINVLITVPRHHSILDSIFKGSITRRLAFESSIPILAAHE